MEFSQPPRSPTPPLRSILRVGGTRRVRWAEELEEVRVFVKGEMIKMEVDDEEEMDEPVGQDEVESEEEEAEEERMEEQEDKREEVKEAMEEDEPEEEGLQMEIEREGKQFFKI